MPRLKHMARVTTHQSLVYDCGVFCTSCVGLLILIQRRCFTLLTLQSNPGFMICAVLKDDNQCSHMCINSAYGYLSECHAEFILKIVVRFNMISFRISTHWPAIPRSFISTYHAKPYRHPKESSPRTDIYRIMVVVHRWRSAAIGSYVFFFAYTS